MHFDTAVNSKPPNLQRTITFMANQDRWPLIRAPSYKII